MKLFRKLTAVVVITAFAAFAAAAPASAAEEDTMSRTLRTTAYGGLIGALVGSALMLLKSKPTDHLDYVTRGAALGLIAGAAYGVATGSVSIQSAGEVKDGKLTWQAPTVQREESYEKISGTTEVVERVEVLTFRY